MYKEINDDDKSLFEVNGLATEPQGNMTLEEEAAMKAELEVIGFFERCNKF